MRAATRSIDLARATVRRSTPLGATALSLAWLSALGGPSCSCESHRGGEVGVYDPDAGTTAGTGGSGRGSAGSGAAGASGAAGRGAPATSFQVEITPSEASLCPGECVELQAQAEEGAAPYDYRWSRGLPEGEGPHEVCPEETGLNVYTVTVSDSSRSEDEFVAANPDVTATARVTVQAACDDAGPPQVPEPGGEELCSTTFAQQPTSNFGVKSMRVRSGLATDPDGNVILAGSLVRDASIVLGSDTFTASGDLDGIVAKIDADCGLVWARHYAAQPGPFFPGSPSMSALELGPLAVDADGSVFLLGTFRGAVQALVGSAGELGVVLLKLSSAGEIAWLRPFSLLLEIGPDASDVVVDADGNVTIAVLAPNNVSFGAPIFDLEGSGLGPVIASYDRDGEARWARRLVGVASDVDIEVRPGGGVTVLGQSNIGPVSIQGGELDPPAFAGQSFILSLDANGDLERGTWIDPLELGQASTGASLTRDAATFAALWLTWTVPNPDDTFLPGTAGILTLGRYAEDHVPLWEKAVMTVPQAGSSHGHAVMTGSGAIVTSGMFGSVQQFVVDPRTSDGETDVFVEKHTAAGELMWRTVFGSPEYDEEIGLAVDHADNSFVLVRGPTGLSLTKLAP